MSEFGLGGLAKGTWDVQYGDKKEKERQDSHVQGHENDQKVLSMTT